MALRQFTTRTTGLLLATTLCASLLMASNAATQEIPKEVIDLGESVYHNHCASCHGEVGGGGDVPPLAINSRLRDEGLLIGYILRGGMECMPGFAFLLSDAEVAAVATYVRNSWGNDFGPVAEEQVIEMR